MVARLRELAALLGLVLIASGLLGSAGVLPETGQGTEGLTGDVAFGHADIAGTTTVEANEAAVRAEGAFRAHGRSEAVTVTVFRATDASVAFETGTDPNAAGGYTYRVEQTVTRDSYVRASLELSGEANGLLRAWPNASHGGASFDLALAPDQQLRTNTSPVGVDFIAGDEWYSYQLDGPVFGLGHHTGSYHMVNASVTRFDELHVTGGVNILVDGGLLTVEDPTGTRTYDLRDGQSTGEPTGTAGVEDRVYAVVSLDRGQLGLGFDEQVSATWFAHDPSWTVDGTVGFDASEGTLEANGTHHPVGERSVQVTGRTVLDTTGIPGGDRSLVEPIEHYRVLGALQPEPIVQATLASEGWTASVDGEPVPAGDPPTQPEDLSLWGQILGGLLLLWSMGKKALVFAVGLLTDAPLEHPRRERIHAFLEDRGMAHLREIHRGTGIPVASLAYHLEVLEQGGLLASVERAGYTAYFLASPDLTQGERRRLALLANPTRQEIAELLLERGRTGQAELSERAKVSRTTVSRQLAKLVDAGLVERYGARNSVYEPSELLRRWSSGSLGTTPS